MNNQSLAWFELYPNNSEQLFQPTANNVTSLIFSILTIVPVQLIIILIAVGNGMVILAVIYDIKLRRQHQNWLIVSLSVADFLVGIMIMPFSLAYQVQGVWIFGWVWCELWLALDVLFVTSSIIHLCLISIDRLWSIVYPIRYLQIRSKRFITVMIILAWLTAFLISFPPLVGWRPPVRIEGSCELSNETGYVLYSAFGSFYIPFIVLMVVNTKIFIVARQRLRKRQYTNATQTMLLLSTQQMLQTCETVAASNSDLGLDDRLKKDRKGSFQVLWPKPALKLLTPQMFRKKSTNDRKNGYVGASGVAINPAQQTVMNQMQKHKKREMRATIILGVVLTAFLACWLPFFVVYLLSGFGVKIEKQIFAVFFWLGYVNSALNPPIYTLCNPEFRRGFKKICYRRRNEGGATNMLRKTTARGGTPLLIQSRSKLLADFSSKLRREPTNIDERRNETGFVIQNESVHRNGSVAVRDTKITPI